MIDLSAIITTFETKKLLKRALESVVADLASSELSYEIIVVENGSHDGTSAMVKDCFPQARLIENAENLGLARALNQGITSAGDSRYVLIMDSDVEVHPGGITRIIHYLEDHPLVSGCSAAEYDAATNKRKRGRAGIGLSLRRPDYDRPFQTEFTGNTFVIVRNEALQSIGLFDEKYVFSVEDLDWNHRALLEGHVFMYVPDAVITHHGRQGKHQNHDRVTAELYRTNYYYYRKFYSPMVAWLMYWALRVDLAVNRFRARRARRDTAKVPAFDNALRKLKDERSQYRQIPHAE